MTAIRYNRKSLQSALACSCASSRSTRLARGSSRVIRILGSTKRSCDGLTRRDLLHVGVLAPLGLSLADWMRAQASSTSPTANGFGRARRCILLYLWGSPSQLETFDPKPDAPLEVRGEFRSIPTTLTGVRIGEILPRIARLLDRVTVLRSLTHQFPIHGTAFAMTGVPATDLTLESNPRDPRQWPYVGAVVDFLAEKSDPKPPVVPRNFGLPFLLGSRRRVKPGPFGGFLGGAYDTVWSDFRAKGTREVLRNAGAPDVPTKVVADPYLGILPSDRFEAVASDETITFDRLNRRASLLDQLDSARSELGRNGAHHSFDRHRVLARSVLTSGKLRGALDVQREPSGLRERYGMTLFGQSCLAARRLLEAGGTFVTVCWDEYGLVNTGWDTHVHMRSRLREELGPGFDSAFATLLEDLDARGMLADTAVAVVSEHGRTPVVQKVAEGGRDHWSRAYSALFAGAGFAKGRVVGRTDRIAGDVNETPFSPKDVVATLFHVLGIDPRAEIHDSLGRPYPVGGAGRVRSELLA
jgi:hypothetical protein